MKRLALFASGAGSNALNLLQAASAYTNLEINTLIVDTVTSLLPELVTQQYPSLRVERVLPNPELKGQQRKQEHESRIVEVLQQQQVEWVLLAGYMRILGPTLLGTYSGHIINIHPSLLPLFPGVDSYRRAFEAGVKESGVTIHLVDEGIDTGPVILQQSFPRYEADSLADFVQRGKDIEWKLYPQILEKISQAATLLPGV